MTQIDEWLLPPDRRSRRRCCRQPPRLLHRLLPPLLLRTSMRPRPHRNRADHVPRHARNSSSALPAHLGRYTHQCRCQWEETKCGICLYGTRAAGGIFFGSRGRRCFRRYDWLEGWMVHVRWSDSGVPSCGDMDDTGGLLDTASKFEEIERRHRLDRSDHCNSMLGFACLCAGVSSLTTALPNVSLATNDTLIVLSHPALQTLDTQMLLRH